MKILCVVGARPNFIKSSPRLRSLGRFSTFETRLVHTGQHYDGRLSDVFFRQLRIPEPDVELEVGAGTQTAQTAEIMRRFEAVLEAEQPKVVLVVGDVNSTIACALATAKFRLREPFRWAQGWRTRPAIVHVEAGLRSFDDDMPEEVNRKLTDVPADLLFVSEPAGILRAFEAALDPDTMRARGLRRPALWDGKAADRVVAVLVESFQQGGEPASGWVLGCSA